MATQQLKKAEAATTGRGFLPSIVIADGTVEALKWLALALMTIDHVNKYLFHEASHIAFCVGRVAMPLFAFVLAYNLARPATLAAPGAGNRIVGRLAVAAVVSTAPYIALGGVLWGWWPLNIMATLAAAAAVIALLHKPSRGRAIAAAAVFVAAGAVVEFWWPGIAACVSAWLYCRRPGWAPLVAWVGSIGALYFINGNSTALLAFPVIFAARSIELKLPRLKWIFYSYYPVHLAAIFALMHVL